MLSVKVIAKESIGGNHWIFKLGMHFSEIVAIIQEKLSEVQDIQILYDLNDVFSKDLILHLQRDGIKLTFDSNSQRLNLIQVIDMKLVQLTYGDKASTVFNSPKALATRLRIDETFGATTPEIFDENQNQYKLEFPGLAFYFPIELNGVHNTYQLLASSMVIYAGSAPETSSPPEPSRNPGLITCQAVAVERKGNVNVGLKMALMCTDKNGALSNVDVRIRFGDSHQSVISAISTPNKTFYVTDNKMHIHKSKKPNEGKRSDYFLNYFTYGIDILIDAYTHNVKQFILHSNIPGHHNFNHYYRCNFSVPFVSSKKQRHHLVDLSQDTFVVTASTKWSEVEANLDVVDKPLVQRNAAPDIVGNTAPTTHYHTTHLYHYIGCVFEVMKNGHIPTITLRKPISA